jgi:flagellar biosynthesis/type III secretory pathway protein FliH
MTLRRARVLSNSDATRALPAARVAEGTLNTVRISPPRAAIVPRVVADAQARAAAIVRTARDEARQILTQAEASADDLILQQQARARADALCLVVGEALELRKRQAELSKNALERSIGFATLLAERLLGEELEQKPERVRALARQALKEAAGARQAVLIANPRDAAELRAGLAGLSGLLDSLGIEEDAGLARGQLRVETELGVIEADLRGQLQRLATQLKKLLESHAAETD